MTAVVLVATRIRQFVKSGCPFFGDGSPGARQLKSDCGLGPVNGVKPKLGSPAGKRAMPSAPTVTAAGAVALSQCPSGAQPASVGDVPSHCSTLTDAPGAKPDATTVNDCGRPSESDGTASVPGGGCTTVAACAGAAPPTAHTTTNVMSQRRRILLTYGTNVNVKPATPVVPDGEVDDVPPPPNSIVGTDAVVPAVHADCAAESNR